MHGAAGRKQDATSESAAGPASFEIRVSDEILADLTQRLDNVRLPAGDSPEGWDLGMDPGYLREILDYWRNGFDWRAQERYLNGFRQFIATVDGTRLHFIHERGRGPAPLPLLLTHGFPDSFYRFRELIPRLTDPASHGGNASEAFDVVVPSLPGYAFSEPRRVHGGLFGFGDSSTR
jgi:hypothetical protein